MRFTQQVIEGCIGNNLADEASMLRHGIGDVGDPLVEWHTSDHNTPSVLSQSDSLKDRQYGIRVDIEQRTLSNRTFTHGVQKVSIPW